MKRSFPTITSAITLCLSILCQAEDKPTDINLLAAGKLEEIWKGYQSDELAPGWSLDDGILTLQPLSKEEKKEKGISGDLVTREKWADFEITLDWKISKGGNSGIFFRANEESTLIWHSSMEIQILDSVNFKPGGKDPKPLKESQKQGAVYELYDANPESFRPHGEWNTTKIRAVGTKITVHLNDVLVADFDTASDDFKERFTASKFASKAPNAGSFPSGQIGLQDHGGEVAFRNIVLTPLG